MRTAAAHHQPGVLPGVFPALTCTRPPPPRHSVGSFWAVAVCLSQGANERENSAALGRGGGVPHTVVSRAYELWGRHVCCVGAVRKVAGVDNSLFPFEAWRRIAGGGWLLRRRGGSSWERLLRAIDPLCSSVFFCARCSPAHPSRRSVGSLAPPPVLCALILGRGSLCVSAWECSGFRDLELPHTVEWFSGKACGCTLCSGRCWVACIQHSAVCSQVRICSFEGWFGRASRCLWMMGMLPTTCKLSPELCRLC